MTWRVSDAHGLCVVDEATKTVVYDADNETQAIYDEFDRWQARYIVGKFTEALSALVDAHNKTEQPVIGIAAIREAIKKDRGGEAPVRVQGYA